MEISSRALPAVAGERATMFVALELSKSTWLVALHSPVADKVSQYRFTKHRRLPSFLMGWCLTSR